MLLQTFPPIEEEGRLGYLRRLASTNGYRNWKSLLRAYGINPTLKSMNGAPAETLTHSLGIEPEWWAVAELADGKGALGDPIYRRIRCDAVCPRCLGQAEYVPHKWSHCFVTACAEHNCRLIDACPDCGDPIRDVRTQLRWCDCGFDLSESPVRRANAVEIWISSRIAGDLKPTDGIGEIGSPTDYVLLPGLLDSFCAPTKRVRSSGRHGRKPATIDETLKFLGPAINVLQDFDERFPQMVKGRFEAAPARSPSLTALLGPWYTKLRSVCDEGRRFEPVWSKFSNVAITMFDGILRGEKALKVSPGTERRFVTSSEAARMLGVRRESLMRAVSKGEIEVKSSHKLGPNYAVSMVDVEAIKRIANMRRTSVNLDGAAELLHVPVSVVRALVESGVLRSNPKWADTIFAAGPLSIHDLEQVQEQVLSSDLKHSDCETISFAEISARRTVDKTALMRLYRALFDGSIRPVCLTAGEGLGGARFSLTEVKRFLGSAALSNGYTLVQLERITGWKYESLARWAKLGYLQHEVVTLQGKNAVIVSLPQIFEFKKAWLPVADLARMLGTKASALTNRMERLGIQPEGHAVVSGVRRGGLVAVSDVVKLVQLKSLA